MRQLLAMIGAAIRAACRFPIDAVEAILEAFRPKPATAAADFALDQVEAAIAQAQEAKQPVGQAPASDLEAAVRSALAYLIVNERRLAAGQPLADGPDLGAVDERLGEWAARLNGQQAQRVLNAMGARPGAFEAHLTGSARILGVPVVLALDTYREMAAADAEVALREEPEPSTKIAI